ncbi:ribonuclease H-like domain-containing protein [Tanacetum coccineum]
MEFKSVQSNTTAKIPILKLGEYEMWVIRIKQYFQVQDYALWEVIKHGNSWVFIPQTAQKNGTSVTKMSVHVTAEEKTNKKNDVKARSLLLMALPNEHQLTFSQYNDAKTMFAAIETRFGVWMNKSEIKTMSIDDLYNNFKIVEQSVKKSFGASSGAQNLAFMTTPSTSSTNDVNTAKPAYEVSIVSPNVNTASPQVSTASFSDNVVYVFIVENPNSSNLLQQDLEQIHEDDLEAMDLKWQLSLLSMREKRYYQRTGKKIFINANDTAGYDKFKVECFNCHKMGHFAKECRAPRNKECQFRNQDNTRKHGNNEDISSKAMLAIDGVDSEIDLSYSGLDEFKEPKFKSYGSEDSKQESNIGCDKKSDDSKENSDDSLGKPQQDDTGFIDSGCSRHMTGNIAYLSDFKEFDGGYVTFGGGAHGGRISGKGTLKTDSLDFEDVYFVNELNFNLFSVSQMCDKKNYVLFTNTECLVISPNFNLPDESQILLRIPRKDNMYNFDMKNIVPRDSLTCLVAKATSDESML